MLLTYVFALLIFATIVVIMAVGVCFGREAIRGSCGGLSKLGMKESCDICGGDQKKCKKAST